MIDRFAWGLQKAVYTQLSNNNTLQALIGVPPRVYDGPPRKAVFPYIALGETRIKDWSGVDGGLEHDIRVHVFSRYQGRREVKEILNTVYDALHEQSFSIDGRKLIHIRFVFADVFPRNDGGVFQGVSRFRAMTQPETVS